MEQTKQQEASQENQLGTAPIGKLLFTLAVPAITAQVVNMLYNIVDRIYIGHIPEIGTAALTGVGITFPIITLISAFSSLIAMGGAPRASIAMGAHHPERAEQIMGNCLTALLGLSVVLTALFLLFLEPILWAFGASSNTIGYAMEYMGVYVWGTVFVQISLGMNMFITSQGFAKTSMFTVVIGAALNIALEAGKRSGKSVAVFSLEMNREQLGMRLISMESLIDSKKLLTGRLSGEEEWTRAAMAVAALSQANIYLDDDAGLSVADMNAKCRRVKNLGLVVVDYLQLMTSAGGPQRAGDNRQQIVSDMSRSLKLMAKELNVPVLCLSQLSRANESRAAGQRRPLLSDLRESGSIEQDADVVLFIYRESYYENDTDNPNVAECIVAKNRHGETGTVLLEWRPEFTTFRNLAYRDEEDDYG